MPFHFALQPSGALCGRIGRMGRVSDPSPQAADLDAESGSPEPPLHQALGLTDDEFAQIGELLGRQPNHLELAMYSVMWSEHCSYKSSRVHLGRFPTEAPWVLVGPGENAGVVDVGDGIAVALRIESHNHPSAIEPYQGAATGIGGIVRDIFTMGARPIALMDPLRFGPLDDARSRWIAEGVVSGVSGYGNSVGIPTVGGEVVFDETYTENPLVNVFCLGILPTERLVLAKASGEGNLAVLLGNSTGRDGIGGVSVLASAEFAEGDEAKRPSVQVGDPFEEKRLIEATLALLDAGLVVGIQDLGGAGLTCATSETAANANMGMDVDVSAVHQRELHMSAVEVLTSESQERMLAIVEPENLDAVLVITDAWEVRASAIGTVTDTGLLRVFDEEGGEVLAEVPATTLHEDAPLLRRPLAPPEDLDERWADEPDVAATGDQTNVLLGMVMDTSWVSSQYDHQLFLNTVVGPGGDATVLRLRDPRTGADTGRGLGLSADGNHRWTASDPERGAAMVVAESVMNLAAVGARPLALVNCLNFGNPEHPEVMWQLSSTVDGMAGACTAMDLPVVGGNVSLYNTSGGRNIDPTPVVTTLGLIDDLSAVPPGLTLAEGTTVMVLGTPTEGLAGSRWAWDQGLRGGRVPEPDLAAVKTVAELTRSLVADGTALAVHDVSEGGLALALAEMAVAGDVGLETDGHDGGDRTGSTIPDTTGGWFGESAGRMVVAVSEDELDGVLDRAHAVGVDAVTLGHAGGSVLRLGQVVTVDLQTLRDEWRSRLPAALGSGNLSE